MGHFHARPFYADELFRDLAPRSVATLRKIRKAERFSKNDTVLAAGDLPKCIYILSSGQARMTLTNGIDRVTKLRLVKTDEILGLNEMFGNSFCQMNVETITPCVFHCLRRNDFMNFLDREPAICYRLLRTLAGSIQSGYERFMDTSFSEVR